MIEPLLEGIVGIIIISPIVYWICGILDDADAYYMQKKWYKK